MEIVVIADQLKKYYSGRKVFITGHTGFKGAWLTALLHVLGAKVKGLALEPEQAHCLFNLMQPFQLAESVIADIRDKEKLAAEIESFQPDYIFHLAAQPLVRRSYAIPAETFEVNATGTANLLEAANKLSKKCTIVIVTTDKVYKNKEQDILYKEDDILGGYDPYSASKACAEIIVSSFRDSFFSPDRYTAHKKAISSARAGNVIGGGDWSTDRIVPDIVRSLQNSESIAVRNPGAVRPWQHVLEPLTGYLLLGGLLNEKPESYSMPYNFGPNPEDHLTVKELVELCIATWGKGEWKDMSGAVQPHEAGLLKLDISRAVQQLHWKPKLSASKAIEWTINWYRQPASSQADYSFEQINNYLAL
ncbi:MAG: CDP-glucose 4,6-dehydratase [Chitinophagaceae bacterium]